MDNSKAADNKQIEIIAGRFVVRLPDAVAAHDFLEEAERREARNRESAAKQERARGKSPPSVQAENDDPDSQVDGEQDAVRVEGALRGLPEGRLGNELSKELFPEQRYRLSNVIKLVTRRAKAAGFPVEDALVVTEEGRTNRLIAGPRLRELIGIASDPAPLAPPEPATPALPALPPVHRRGP